MLRCVRRCSAPALGRPLLSYFHGCTSLHTLGLSEPWAGVGAIVARDDTRPAAARAIINFIVGPPKEIPASGE